MSRFISVALLLAVALAISVCPALADDQSCWVPQFVNCPDMLSMDRCDSISYQFQAVNPHTGQTDPAIRYRLVAGPGLIDSCTGFWSVSQSKFPRGVQVSASHGEFETSRSEQCNFLLRVANHRPWLTISGTQFEDTLDLPVGQTASFPIAAGDSDLCDSVVVSAVTIGPAGGSVSIGGGDPMLLQITPVVADPAFVWPITVRAFDGGKAADYMLFVRGYTLPPISLQIDHVTDVIQGTYVDVDVTFSSSYWSQMSGYNLLMTFDNSALAFANAFPGPAFGPGGCAWEYFHVRFGAEGNCPTCPVGLVRIVGLAETNNGPYHPTCFQPDSFPATLFTMRFLVSNDRTFECTTLPIRFFWIDCTDNSLSSDNGEHIHISQSVAEYDHPDIDISDPNAGFPTYLGAPYVCDSSSSPNKPVPLRTIGFVNGALQIACSTYVSLIGDVNLNGLPYEVADYELFRDYLTLGPSVFTVDINHQPAATNVNHDGRDCSLPDLVSFNRIIAGLAVPPVGQPPYSRNPLHLYCERASGILYAATPDTLGAVYLEYDGEVIPELLQVGPHLSYHFDGTQTKVLMAPPTGEVPMILSGELLSCGESNCPTRAEAATWRGGFLNVSIGDITDSPDDPSSLPTAFALHPNYPNPFNATTVISFDLPRAEQVTLEIVNLLGQRVFTRTAQYGQGTHQITWNGNDDGGHGVASGVYYFRLTAAEFSATRKMMLLK